MTDFESLAQTLYALRKKHLYSQEQVALEADICLSNYRAIEQGRGNPTLQTLIKLADLYQLHISALLQPDTPLKPADKETYILSLLQKISPEDQQYLISVLELLLRILKEQESA
jgi:transcriptional regulator with XRE-family HTH domain